MKGGIEEKGKGREGKRRGEKGGKDRGDGKEMEG